MIFDEERITPGLTAPQTLPHAQAPPSPRLTLPPAPPKEFVHGEIIGPPRLGVVDMRVKNSTYRRAAVCPAAAMVSGTNAPPDSNTTTSLLIATYQIVPNNVC
jgi:hypothetical protein